MKLGKISGYLRWVARIAGSLFVLMILVFAVGEGLPAASSLSAAEKTMFIGLAAALAGLLISWRWTLAGCLAVAAGYAVFSIGGRGLYLDSPFLIIPIILALHAMAWFFIRLSARQTETING